MHGGEDQEGIMAFPGISSDFDLDDHGILRDSFASDFQVDVDGILHDSGQVDEVNILHDSDILFKHTTASSGGHGTDSGIGADKQSSMSTLQQFHTSFDENLALLGDESINISDFEASKDDLDSLNGDLAGGGRKRSRLGYGMAKELETAESLDTPGSTLEHPEGFGSGASNTPSKRGNGEPQHHQHDAGEDQDLFTEDYYLQLRELGVLVDGADFSRDESQTEFEALESHLSQEHLDFDDDNRDLIGEYLQTECEREHEEEDEGEESDEQGGGQSQAALSSRANSAPTISEQSFPEISPEDAEIMYRRHAGRNGVDVCDKLYLTSHQPEPSSSLVGLQECSSGHDEDNEPDSHSQTPCVSHWHARRSPSPSSSDGQGFLRSRSETNTPQKKAWPDSAASDVSLASYVVVQKTSHQGQAMAKAQSQESFFQQKHQPGRGSGLGDKVPKRLLPTPSAPDPAQSLRLKTKSRSISNMSAPVRPTYHLPSPNASQSAENASSTTTAEGMSTSAGNTTQDKTDGELSTQLKQESSRRRQATELVQQLQKEYDSLLSKYALAELTIDQMRLGAHITLHADPPKPASIQGSGASPAGRGHKAHVIQLPTLSAQRASITGQYEADGSSLSTSHVQTSLSITSQVAPGGDSPVSGIYGNGEVGNQERAAAGPASEDRTTMIAKTPRMAESVQMSIQTEAASLNDRIDQFIALMDNEHLTMEEQEKAFDNIRTDHEKLRRSFLQAKEDYNVLRRSGAELDADFDQQKEVEGQLFRLGMKFDEVQERVDSSLKLQISQRQPFHTSHLALNDEEEEVDGELPVPYRGSYSSLLDSGISDQDIGPHHHRPENEALVRLPGPCHLKQLTHQRGDNDMDSGFIGSVVSTNRVLSPAQHWLPQTPLRLQDRNENPGCLNITDSISTVGSQCSGKPSATQLRSQATVVPALVGISCNSDHSYDAELEESTLSDQLLSKDASSSMKRREESSVPTQSLRAQTQLFVYQGDETLEDVSDAEMSDTANPQGMQPSVDAYQQLRLHPSHPRPPSPHTRHRPPTPHQPSTPKRSPTPYQREKGKEESGWQDGGMGVVGERRMINKGPLDYQVVVNRSQQRRSGSPVAYGPLTPHSQRPESCGEPTTHLYHTRPHHCREDTIAVESARADRCGAHKDRQRKMVPDPAHGEEERVGSDVDVRSDATRGSSVNSGRLRLLQDEIEKLKEGVRQAHEKAAHQPIPLPKKPPPPLPAAGPQQLTEGSQYYDPFDDPYGFMRVPLHRANSCGRGVRKFDDWYRKMSGGDNADDIPLGYAATDTYNHHHCNKTPTAASHRLHHKQQSVEEAHPKTIDQGGGGAGNKGSAGIQTVSVASAPSLSTTMTMQIHRPPAIDPQVLYSYYLPLQNHQSHATLTPSTTSQINQYRQHNTPLSAPSTTSQINQYRQHTTPLSAPLTTSQINQYRQHTTPLSASQPNLAETLAGVEPNTYPHQARQPWYTIRRAQWPAPSSRVYPTLGQQAQVVGYPVQSVGSQAEAFRFQSEEDPSPPARQMMMYYVKPEQEGIRYRMEPCSLCGGAGAHIHEDDVEPVQGYMAQDFATNPRHEPNSRSRPRSRSVSRRRHYTPERSSSHSRYLVREFGDNISDESDLEFRRGHHRSRSLSRSGVHSATRSPSGWLSSGACSRRYHHNVQYNSDEDVDLNESLGLSEDINRLAHHMLGTLEGELHRQRHRKEFGSSYW